jgi:hypothetical protein
VRSAAARQATHGREGLVQQGKKVDADFQHGDGGRCQSPSPVPRMLVHPAAAARLQLMIHFKLKLKPSNI